ncbi:MAG TPA: arabinofuranosidase catalytic domain-containing protein, partial [Ktedonobacteraceae bacterium]|nr:arabinofuranosidase catalytic domain-containing protein [Ktedonobacteraceae bacterium]
MGPGIFLVLALHDRTALDKVRAPALFIEIRKKTISRSWKGHKDVKQSISNAAHLRPLRWRKVLTLLAAMSLIAGIFGMTPLLSASPPSAFAAGSQPCDIYASGGTPCVAAHSTTRALFGAYNGNLYQVRRSSDNATLNIGVLSAGGFANAAAQDSFCAGTTCVITIIYDQTGRGNHLTQAPPGGFSGPASGGFDNLANATAAPITLSGHKAYGVFVAPGTGYRNNNTNGIATGDNPEGMYAIFDGTHFNGGCCFDYGNAETNSRDDGNGTMEAIYFGNIKVWGFGTGNGPWIMADLENGLYSGVNFGFNSNDPTVNFRYTTAIVKGEPNHWSIRGGNAQSGSLSTFYNGARPNVSGYNPMKKQGAIILGIGGDNSIGAAGTFYEGVMTSGYPSDATENAVQA